MHDALGKLLGSPSRIKLLRLFLLNPGVLYTASEITLRARVPMEIVRKELSMYEDINLILTRKARGKRVHAYTLNPKFVYLEALQHLLLNLPMRSADIAKRLRVAGNLKLIILSGLFADDYQGRVDILIVGDRFEDGKLKGIIRKLEAEIGKELRYVALKTSEFKYRLDIYDKLVRDVLDYTHVVALDKLNVPLK